MITFLVSDMNRNPLRKLLRRAGTRLPKMQIITYQSAFRRLWVPGGTLVFTDFDLLTDYELDAAGTIAAAVGSSGRILNAPTQALERAQMLRHLHARGLNAVQVTRIEDEMPRRYPVFIRFQGGCERPDTDLLADEAAYNEAVRGLIASGRPLRGRIAVSYETATDSAGFFRKYGAIRIGDHIIPQHILRAPGWYVKRSNSGLDADFAKEELDFIHDNPHRDALIELFDAAGYQFGRADYTLRDGKIVLFEINSNPSFPKLTKYLCKHSERSRDLLEKINEAFQSIDDQTPADRIRFELNMAVGHYVMRQRWSPIIRQLWRQRLVPSDQRAIIAQSTPEEMAQLMSAQQDREA